MAYYDPYYYGHHRSHSHGRVEQNVFVPPQNVWMAPPASPPQRGRAVDHLADEIHHLAMETGRSRSRGREIYHPRSHSPTLAELEAQVAALKAESAKLEEGKKRDDIISKYEYEQAEKKRKEEAKWKEYEAEQAEKKRKEEAKLKEMKEKIKMQEILEKEKKDNEYKAFEIERERRIAEEKAKKKKEEEKAAELTRETLRKAGYSEYQIERVMKLSEKDKEKAVAATTTTTTVAVSGSHSHQYPHGHHHGSQIVVGGPGRSARPWQARRKDIAPEILDKYGIGWRSDPADPEKKILIYTDDQALLQVLNEETRALKHDKKKILLIEEKKKHKEPGLAIVRKRGSRSRSRSRARSSERIIIVGR